MIYLKFTIDGHRKASTYEIMKQKVFENGTQQGAGLLEKNSAAVSPSLCISLINLDLNNWMPNSVINKFESSSGGTLGT